MATNRSDADPDALAELRECVERLTQHVEVLTQAVDQLTDELQWSNNEARHRGHVPPPPPVLKSMPLDPTTDDWRINQHPAVKDGSADQPAKTKTTRHGSLFD